MTADALTTNTEPDWLVAARAAAADRFEQGDLPTSDREEWRYSRVAGVELGSFTVADQGSASGVSALLEQTVGTFGAVAGRMVVHNGHVVELNLGDDASAAGVTWQRQRDLSTPVAAHAEAADDAFSDFNEAHSPDPVVLTVPRGVVVDDPFEIVMVGDRADTVSLPRMVVIAGENSQFGLIEWSTSGAERSLVIPRLRLSVAAAARVTMVSVNDLGPSSTQLGEVIAEVGQEATVSITHVALGGDYSRNRFDCRLVGRGATGVLATLYAGTGDQMHDLRTFQTHEARDTTSDLLFKGALDDRAHAVYTGMIRVDHEGRGSNANQSNRVIKLSEDAVAESVPNLEINHNDVRCAHATAVGPIDEDQRFYLESRGVPPEVAERLVVNGFFEEVLDTIAVPAVAERVRAMVEAKLGGST